MRRVGRVTRSVTSPAARGFQPRVSSSPADKILSTPLLRAIGRRNFISFENICALVTILFGTLGWRPQSLVPSIRSTEGLERLVFYHSDHAKSRDARAKVMDLCRSLGVPAVGV